MKKSNTAKLPGGKTSFDQADVTGRTWPDLVSEILHNHKMFRRAKRIICMVAWGALTLVAVILIILALVPGAWAAVVATVGAWVASR